MTSRVPQPPALTTHASTAPSPPSRSQSGSLLAHLRLRSRNRDATPSSIRLSLLHPHIHLPLPPPLRPSHPPTSSLLSTAPSTIRCSLLPSNGSPRPTSLPSSHGFPRLRHGQAGGDGWRLPPPRLHDDDGDDIPALDDVLPATTMPLLDFRALLNALMMTATGRQEDRQV